MIRFGIALPDPEILLPIIVFLGMGAHAPNGKTVKVGIMFYLWKEIREGDFN